VTNLPNASSAYFAWKHFHPHEAEDPRAVWAAAYKAGGRAALLDSGHISELIPLLQDLLHLFADGQVEADVRASDRRKHPIFDEPVYEYEGQHEVVW
jgi:hypothetical protein